MHGKEHSILALPVYTRIYSTGAARLTFSFSFRRGLRHLIIARFQALVLLCFCFPLVGYLLLSALFSGGFSSFLFGGVEFVFEGR